MGGFAALHITFLHSDMFSKVGGHSPGLWVDKFPSDYFKYVLYPDGSARAQRDPVYIASSRELSNIEVYLDCGDEVGYKFYQGCDKLYNILKSRNVRAEYHLNPGAHDGNYWRGNMDKYLVFYAGGEKE